MRRIGGRAGNLHVSKSFNFRKYPSWYSLLAWLFKKPKIGCSSGGVSSAMSINEGVYVKAMDGGREVRLHRVGVEVPDVAAGCNGGDGVSEDGV